MNIKGVFYIPGKVEKGEMGEGKREKEGLELSKDFSRINDRNGMASNLF